MVRCSIYFRASQHLNLVTTNLGDVVRLLTVGVRFGQNFENWGLRGYMEKNLVLDFLMLMGLIAPYA